MFCICSTYILVSGELIAFCVVTGGVEWYSVVNKLERCGSEEGRGNPSWRHGDEEMGILSFWTLLYKICAVFWSAICLQFGIFFAKMTTCLGIWSNSMNLRFPVFVLLSQLEYWAPKPLVSLIIFCNFSVNYLSTKLWNNGGNWYLFFLAKGYVAVLHNQ